MLGRRIGVCQAFPFGDTAMAPFEVQVGTAARFRRGEGNCYYAGGVLGGSRDEMLWLFQNTTFGMEYDRVYRESSPWHDDESHVNRCTAFPIQC